MKEVRESLIVSYHKDYNWTAKYLLYWFTQMILSCTSGIRDFMLIKQNLMREGEISDNTHYYLVVSIYRCITIGTRHLGKGMNKQNNHSESNKLKKRIFWGLYISVFLKHLITKKLQLLKKEKNNTKENPTWLNAIIYVPRNVILRNMPVGLTGTV